MTAVDDASARTQRAFAPVSASRWKPADTDVLEFSPAIAQTASSFDTQTTVTPRTSSSIANRQSWERSYRRRLRISDAAIIVLVCTLSSFVWFQVLHPWILLADPWILARVPLATAFVWFIMLTLFSTREPAHFGSGATEYKRVAHATAMTFGALSIAFVVFQWPGIRTQLFLAFPIGLLGLLLNRWVWRRWLVRQRAMGRFASRTVVVGDRGAVEYVIRTLGTQGEHGYLVVGAAVHDETADAMRIDHAIVPLLSGQSWVAQAASLEADTIIVASQPGDDPDYIKHLAWQVEGTAAELVLSSRIADVAGPRMSLRPVEGLPLIHVQIPTFEGGAYVFKRVFDVAVSFVALLLFAPVAAVIALAIKLDSPGPVFFQQHRIGRDGQSFPMLKFRSMRTDAEEMLADLQAANEGSGLLFKMKDDPRVTRVGKFLRKYSLDEVPQFWNVLRGDMSVVGPRPPLPSEVTAYDGTVFRRLYINPGITGPWQVGGRSDLSWEESVRLDLRYVENWSVFDDLLIMWKTVKVMIKPSGAY
ncbi:sugar transferase [Microbacterium koreense]|uniref:Sugar transferase n=1 Tax=Microbacterium koreense TaxID=323761 RepID=A0ABW2ZNZ9_9MICO